MKIVNPFFPIISLVLFFSATAQKNNLKIKFGDVKPGDFTPAVYMVDSSANAVILADIGSSSFDGSSGGDFVLVYNQHKRIRIMNKNGYSAATIEIPLYVNENEEEKIANLEAVTYNLENGQVVATKLDKASEFKEKYSAHYVIEKFTFPNLKEGSIIEYHYSIISIAGYYSNLRAWDFQGNLPCLWSEYAVTIPIDIFDYVIFKQGYLPYAVDTSSSSHKTYAINYNRPNAILRNSIYSTTVTARWAMQDVPSLKPENYITSLDNYKARIDFQLNSIRYSETNVVEYMGNWKQMAERMMKREDFGMAINADNTWMNDDLKGISASTADDYLKAKKVYEYLRDNFTCTKYYGLFVTTTLKKVFENKSGSVSDINLLLV
ncbi:MAG TPA: DUF3857 domain-containing protein, partial [Panacibacter sp.]|nr:DUF3857 domain-containing protein [Panacibacter sp.]